LEIKIQTMPEGVIEKQLSQVGGISIITLVQNILEEAYNFRASDVHIDPQAGHLRVRYRIDGMLQDAHLVPKTSHLEIISRIKILAGLRTDEHQCPQDGRFRAVLEGQRPVDVRVSIVPTYHGENAVLRLLSDKAQDFSLESLGFSKSNCEKIQAALKKPYGIILATGPTGSGKTTTLYTLIKSLNTKQASIITIEDPIEYAIDGIGQIQTNARAGLTFANGLRSVLRQDPNIIMLGEIRDAETAGIAINTALTGHLVLSTLHTNDAATTLPRLLDMKIESYLIASTVSIAIGQRLVRKICPYCKTAREITPTEQKSLENFSLFWGTGSGKEYYYGAGCGQCNNTGFLGRLGVHEVLVPDEKIRDAVLNRQPAAEIRKIAIAQGMVTIIEDGLVKAQNGLTTIEEVLRTLYE
jgi:type IV pilus assembly protein PilB